MDKLHLQHQSTFFNQIWMFNNDRKCKTKSCDVSEDVSAATLESDEVISDVRVDFPCAGSILYRRCHGSRGPSISSQVVLLTFPASDNKSLLVFLPANENDPAAS